MGKYPWEKNRAILEVLDNTVIVDFKGYFSRNKEWFNPNQIQRELKNRGMGTISRDEITSFLNRCCEVDQHYVEKRKPDRKDPDSETKAQNEYKITQAGRGFLAFSNNPDFELINKKYGK